MYGLDYEVSTSFSYTLADLGTSAHLLPAQVIETLSEATFKLTSGIKYPSSLSPIKFSLSGSKKKREVCLRSYMLLYFCLYLCV